MAFEDHALVVGIDLYPGLTPLQGAERDAREFHAWVVSPDGGGVPPANASLLVSSGFGPAADVGSASPAARHIEEFFNRVDDAAEANNQNGLGFKAGKRVWLFLSGHGIAPSLNQSAVMLANATFRRAHSVAAAQWADRLHEGGWFDDVFLFQDACRVAMSSVELTPPFLRRMVAPANRVRRRFYAFSAKDRMISKEIAIDGREVRGVFTATLMQALKGKARDPVSGALTTAQLKAYLQDNMHRLLPAADKLDDGIAKMPDVFDPDPFDVLAPVATPVPTFPVVVSVSAPGGAAKIEDSNFDDVASVNTVPVEWRCDLARGIYRLTIAGLGDCLFQVTGAVSSDGEEQVVHVAI